jgi:Domain of Unknown Function (DUF1206)
MSIQTPAKPVPVREARDAGEKVGGSTAFEVVARAGFVARGVIYGVIGILAGAVPVAVAVYQGYRGISHDFLDDSKTEEMNPRIRKWSTWIRAFGHLARTVVFGLVGIFLIKAAIDFNPNRAIGLDGALAKLAHHSYGPVLLGVVATGLVAFALYSLSDARYRRI